MQQQKRLANMPKPQENKPCQSTKNTSKQPQHTESTEDSKHMKIDHGFNQLNPIKQTSMNKHNDLDLTWDEYNSVTEARLNKRPLIADMHPQKTYNNSSSTTTNLKVNTLSSTTSSHGSNGTGLPMHSQPSQNENDYRFNIGPRNILPCLDCDKLNNVLPSPENRGWIYEQNFCPSCQATADKQDQEANEQWPAAKDREDEELLLTIWEQDVGYHGLSYHKNNEWEMPSKRPFSESWGRGVCFR